MTLIDLITKDEAARQCLVRFFTDPKFKDIRIAFTNHTPKGELGEGDSVLTHHGMNLGTRHVFNQIEEIASKPPPSQKPKPQLNQGSSKKDPDLQD